MGFKEDFAQIGAALDDAAESIMAQLQRFADAIAKVLPGYRRDMARKAKAGRRRKPHKVVK